MLKKPFILTLLLLPLSIVAFIVVDMVFVIFRMEPNIWYTPIVTAIAALYLGRIYSSVNKIELLKSEKIEIILYYFVIVLALLIGFLAFMCDVRSLSQLQMFVSGVMIPVVAIAAILMYPAFGMGSKMELKLLDKKKD